MFSSFLPLTLLVGAVPLVLAQGFVPLNDKRFTYPDGVVCISLLPPPHHISHHIH